MNNQIFIQLPSPSKMKKLALFTQQNNPWDQVTEESELKKEKTFRITTMKGTSTISSPSKTERNQSSILQLSGIDKIERNLDMFPHQLSVRTQRHFHQMFANERKYSIVVRRRKENETEKKTKFQAKLLAIDQIKELRSFQKQQRIKKYQENQLKKAWLKIIKRITFLENMKYLIQIQLKRRKLRVWGQLWNVYFYCCIMRKIFKTGKTQNQRIRFNAKMAFNQFTQQLGKNIKQRASNLLGKFLRETNMYMTMLQFHSNLNSQVITIQKLYKAMKRRSKYQIDRTQRLFCMNLHNTIQVINTARKNNIENYQIELIHNQDQALSVKQKLLFSTDMQQINQKFERNLINRLTEKFIKARRLKILKILNDRAKIKKNQKQNISLIMRFTLNPPIYDIPSDEEIIELIKQYAKLKRQLL